MANFETRNALVGIQSTIKQLKRADLFTDENVKAMLTAGTEFLYSSVKSAFVEAGHYNYRPRRTGKTYKHFAMSRRVSKDKRGVPYMYVTIRGKDKRGQSYGVKGFTLNYGRRTGGKIPADYYWSNAVKEARPYVTQAMTDKAAEIINTER